MKYLYVLLILSLSMPQLLLSQSKLVAIPSVVKFAPKVAEPTKQSMNDQHWHIRMDSKGIENSLYPTGNRVAEFKNRNASKIPVEKNTKTSSLPKKSRSNNIVLGKNFIGNKLFAHTPSDNTIAISRDGFIVSCDNDQVLYIDTNGVISNDYFLWNDYLDSNSNFWADKYDPRVLYDNANDRFVLIILHAPVVSNINSILIGFSKTNDPNDGWNIYNISGNPFNDSSWCDFPNIAINKKELFLTLNLFGDANKSYNYNQSVIYQISTEDGYAADSNIAYKVWGDVTAPDGYPGFTSVPAIEGLGNLPDQGMHFVQTRIDTGNQVYYYYIDKPLQDTSAKITAFQYTIPDYSVCSDALIKDINTNNIDSIRTGIAWVQSAYIQDSQIHFVFCANVDSGWCGIQHGQLNLKTQTIAMNALNFVGTSLCFPAIASAGFNAQDHAATIVYTQADQNTLPSIGAVAIANGGIFKPPFTIKFGDTIVDILGPAYNQPERWGDYSGIQRHYGKQVPETWLAASYSANSEKRRASFNTWIAQLKSDSIYTNVGLTTPTNLSSDIRLFPSPTVDIFNLEFATSTQARAQIKLIGSDGRMVKLLFDSVLPSGDHQFSFNKGMLAPGNYLVRVDIGQKNFVTKKLVVR